MDIASSLLYQKNTRLNFTRFHFVKLGIYAYFVYYIIHICILK